MGRQRRMTATTLAVPDDSGGLGRGCALRSNETWIARSEKPERAHSRAGT